LASARRYPPSSNRCANNRPNLRGSKTTSRAAPTLHSRSSQPPHHPPNQPSTTARSHQPHHRRRTTASRNTSPAARAGTRSRRSLGQTQTCPYPRMRVTSARARPTCSEMAFARAFLWSLPPAPQARCPSARRVRRARLAVRLTIKKSAIFSVNR
jgi:hypothetical protein